MSEARITLRRVARTYGPLSESVWRDAILLPGHDDLFESLATEIAEFLGISPSSARTAMLTAWESRIDTPRAGFPSVVTRESLAEYYAGGTNGLLVTAYWHSLRPDRYALHGVAALHATQMYGDGPRVFEVGHGIGSTGLLFAQHGMEMTLGDVSDEYAAFAKQRFEQRGVSAEFVDLRSGYPPPESYDVVLSLDVIEHVFEPLDLVREMLRTLRPGGLLVANVAYGRDPEVPEHLLHRRRGFEDRLRTLGLEPIPHPTLDVFWLRTPKRWERPIRRGQDFLNAAWLDVANRYPRLRRLVRRTGLPPLG